jgi:putative endonuclease
MTQFCGNIYGMIFRSFRENSVWKRGENAAARHLKRNGYKILKRNLRLGMGEIDLLCEDTSSGTIVIVEVKARLQKPMDQRRIDPEANITAAKKRKLRTLASAIMKKDGYRDRPIRIDVIAVVFVSGKNSPVELRHFEAAV